MANATKRLNKVARELGVGVSTIAAFLQEKGYEVEGKPNTKIDDEQYNLLLDEYQSDKQAKDQSKELSKNKLVKETITIEDKSDSPAAPSDDEDEVVIKNMTVDPVIDLKERLDQKRQEKEEATKKAEEAKAAEEAVEEPKEEVQEENTGEPKVLGKIDLDSMNLKSRPTRKAKVKEQEKKQAEEQKKKEKPVEAKSEPKPAAKETPKKEEFKPAPKPVEKEKPVREKPEKIETKVEKLQGPNFTGDKIDLSQFERKKKPVASSNENTEIKKVKKKKRRRISDDNKGKKGPQRGRKGAPQEVNEPSAEEIQKEIKDTLARLQGGGKSRGSKYRKAKRTAASEQQEEEMMRQEEEQKVLKVTEFVTATELASLMNVSVNDVISSFMSLGMMVSINQRLDAETMTIVAEEFGYSVEFTTEELDESTLIDVTDESRLKDRPPIVTVMGHVDHGKTSLLDHIRKENVIAGEAGGITQHIGAYSVQLDDGRNITFLDTPGHEAFTAMRSRGAQLTDIAIIVIAADDSIMPQTKEAINHAQAADVPMVFAFNKIDKPGANPDKIREELATMNLLVEDWGGKYQCQEISAKNGTNIQELLDKVLLEAELLELKADAEKRANGTIIEASLDKGKGYVTTAVVAEGTLRVGDVILAGAHSGKVKAMFNERGNTVEVAPPSTPVSILGLNGAPTAGDKFFHMEDEREAKDIATKREQLQREQGVRTKKHITLDEIGRRIAIGDFQELNVIVKGDVDGSIEALSDSLLNLSTEKIQVNILHKSVGQISESDVLLASASNAIIIGFQVRPSAGARALAEKEEIDIRLYSIIYQAIDEVKQAMEGMLKPTVEEKITCNIEVRDVFKISKVGTIAGCFVTDGTVTRNTKVRLIRDGIVVYTGELGSLKRFKDDVKEVKKGFECGLNIENFNDIKVGDVIEGYEEVEVKQTLN